MNKNTLLNQNYICSIGAEGAHVKFEPWDAERVKTAYRDLRHKIVREILFEKHTILPQIVGVLEAYIGIIPAAEYMKLITDEDGELNRGLFYDNVRDYQGENAVNKEIAETLCDQSASDQFVLLNNGITVVARSINKVGAKFRVSDYQVVNGCQTSHVLYRNRQNLGTSLYLPFKLVVTDDSHITNSVIRATNRQTEILPEAFESLSLFHRTLEEFYTAMSREGGHRLYYERRSKQYASQPIRQADIISLAVQAKTFLAMFLNEPHSTHRYYGEILANARSRMFRDNDNTHPYYVAAYSLKRLDHLFATTNRLDRRLRRFKFHLLMLLRIEVGGRKMPPISSKKIGDYCDRICQVIWDDDRLVEALQRPQRIISDALASFDGDRSLAPRLRVFTTVLIPDLRDRPVGRVKYFNHDRGFGFIDAENVGDIFVHFTAIKGVRNTDRYLNVGERVEFDILDSEKGKQAVDVHLLPV